MPSSTAPLILHQGDRIVRSRRDGRIEPDERDGFFVAETRLISRLEWRLAGEHSRLIDVVCTANGEASIGLESAGAVLTIERTVDARGAAEIVTILAPPDAPLSTGLELLIETDFADLFEVRGLAPPRARRVAARWFARESELRLDYRNGGFRRGLSVRVEASASPPTRTATGLVFGVHVPAGGRWTARLAFRPLLGDSPALAGEPSKWGRTAEAEIPLPLPAAGDRAAWDRALLDLRSLELPDPDTARGALAPAAGIPWFACLFGRDSLICGIQAVSVRPDLARGALIRLAALQATGHDPARDMEPGKIPHEYRIGELAALGLTPFGPCYGSHDATSLFIVALSEVWRVTGDGELVRRLWPSAIAAMRWIDEFGDRDGDGFQEYGTSVPGGFRNQGWRDSPDAATGADGSDTSLPTALCEHQGYAFDAKVRLAELAERVLDDPALAGRLRAEAERLRAHFDEAFWWEEEGTYALGLDGRKAQIRTVASNPGHCLWSGIVSVERASRVVARLMREDMFSGWGLRCLSAAHPTYDPFSYHVGSVWPHDTALAVMGLRRYGFIDEADRLARALLDAAACLPLARLPEVFSGLARVAGEPPAPLTPTELAQATTWGRSADPADTADRADAADPEGASVRAVPGLLMEANGPQAWSASAVISLVNWRGRSARSSG
jgi:hypothetical protein